ncbi:hypothetical protein [Mycolicibacterium sp.]|nr:hypothetical protein [Mycolicibacterium sp.]
MRPSTISAFAVGLSFGIVAVVAALVFSGADDRHLPACQSAIVSGAGIR